MSTTLSAPGRAGASFSSTRQGPKLLCSAIDFGYGSAGKLDAILREFPDAVVRFVDSRLGADIGLETHHQIDEVEELSSFDAAIIVLDPELATRLTRSGVSVVYVDSLPHLWGSEDPIPTDVAAYCVQRVAGYDLSTSESLKRVSALHEVDAIIVPKDVRPRRENAAVVNVGGVHSPFGGAQSPYCRLVLPGLVNALRVDGFEVTVIGNVDDETAACLPTDVYAGPVPHRAAATLLSESSVLFTSPGLTTLLEAGAAGIPTVLLPPQNVSQVLNADVVAGQDSPNRIDWPNEYIDVAQVRRLAHKSEMDALNYMYEMLNVIPAGTGIDRYIRERYRAIIPASAEWLINYVERVGTDGAAQVATIVRKVAAGDAP